MWTLKLCRPICFLPCLPDVFIRRCLGAKLQINKAISTSQPMTLTREDLLVATGAGTHEDFIVSTWPPDTESHTGSWAWYDHGAPACNQALILLYISQWLTFSKFHYQLSKLWNGSLSEVTCSTSPTFLFYLHFFLTWKKMQIPSWCINQPRFWSSQHVQHSN